MATRRTLAATRPRRGSRARDGSTSNHSPRRWPQAWMASVRLRAGEPRWRQREDSAVAVTDRQGPLHAAPGGDQAVTSVLPAMVNASPVGLAAINVEAQIVDVN